MYSLRQPSEIIGVKKTLAGATFSDKLTKRTGFLRTPFYDLDNLELDT